MAFHPQYRCMQFTSFSIYVCVYSWKFHFFLFLLHIDHNLLLSLQCCLLRIFTTSFHFQSHCQFFSRSILCSLLPPLLLLLLRFEMLYLVFSRNAVHKATIDIDRQPYEISKPTLQYLSSQRRHWYAMNNASLWCMQPLIVASFTAFSICHCLSKHFPFLSLFQ